MVDIFNIIRSLSRSLAILLLIFTIIIPYTKSAALTKQDVQDLIEQHPYYDPTAQDSANANTLGCLSSSTMDYPGSGPIYGPYFPKVADINDLINRIKNFIEKKNPDLAQHASEFVNYGQQYNINPALLVGVGQADSQLGTTPYGPPPKYNFWNDRDSKATDGTGFKTFSGWREAIEEYYKNLRTNPAYDKVWAKGDAATIDDIINIATPPSDNNDTSTYIKTVKEVMHTILDGIATSNGADSSGSSGSITASCYCSLSDRTTSTTGCTGITAVLATIKAFAWPDFEGSDSLDTATGLHVKGRTEYVAALQKTGAYTGDASVALGADCGAFVTAVIRESGVDPKYNIGNGPTSAQQQYMDQYPEKYIKIGVSSSSDFLNKLQPGDIAVTPNHTYIYVGNAIAGWGGNSASASQNTRTGMASTAYSADSHGIAFSWYRINQ